jgi:sugar/nucleoside kinase (ribokinase family)/fructoselysine-6-P-deglycase FrlB-like protein
VGHLRHAVNREYPPSVIGFGEAILDYVWRPEPDGGVIVDIRGGGSIFNILANLAQRGWQARLQGAAGLDEGGRFAIDDLAALDVDVGKVEFQPRRRTRLIFETLAVDDSLQVGGMAHAFTTKCPVCGQRVRDRQRPTLPLVVDPTPRVGEWAIYDQLTRGRIAHAQQARAAGARTVLDLGAVSYLRYQPTALILSHLREFDLVFLNQRVAMSLTNRIGATAQDLSALLAATIVVTTQGPHGAVVSDASGFSERHPAPSISKLVDDSGAGDALCSYTLDYLAHQHADTLTAAMVATAVGHAQELLAPVLMQIGARGHLPKAPPSPIFDGLRGRTVGGLAAQSVDERQCALCFLPLPQPATDGTSVTGSNQPTEASSIRGFKPGARRNTSLMLARMLSAAEHPTATGYAAELLADRGTAHVVGSGGSLPAATYISGLLNAHGRFSVAVTPGDYLNGAGCADTLIAVSYSGSTQDIRQVIRAAKKGEVRRIVLLTSAAAPTLAEEMRPLSSDVVMSYGPVTRGGPKRVMSTVRERGFVSIAGTVAPCIPWLVAATGLHAVVDLVARIREGEGEAVSSAKALAHQAASAGRLNVVYGPGALPAARDVESKFTESGLPAVTVHEQKDLSHGRFVTVLQGPLYRVGEHHQSEVPPALILATGQRSKYQEAVVRSLQDALVPSAEIRSTTDDLAAPLELLTLVQFFSETFGSELGIDISRPKRIPESGLRLYRWRGGAL